MSNNTTTRRTLRLGMVGGGEGAYIGNIHRIAARQDGALQLVAGAFDVDAERGQRFAASQGIATDRAYGNYQQMLEAEWKHPQPHALSHCQGVSGSWL